MSKAFVSDDTASTLEPDLPAGPTDSSGDRKNYMTPAGAAALRKEFEHLKFKERPEVVKVVEWAAGNGDRSENGDYLYGKRRLREIDKRLGYLSKRLENLLVVDPREINSDQVRFGATVTIRDEDDRERVYAIVGIDEADAGNGKVSWVSPLAQALLKNRVGDSVQVRAPKGVQEIEIVAIEYKEVG
jgi:transcription elongation factor GreB